VSVSIVSELFALGLPFVLLWLDLLAIC